MNKYLIIIVLMAISLTNQVQARIRGNIPATYIENRELVFRHTRMNSKNNPLQIQIVANCIILVPLPTQYC